MNQLPKSILLLSISILFISCGSSGTPPQVVESYLQARMKADANAMVGLACANWENQAKIEANSFKNLSPRLEGLSCAESGNDANASFVTCQGKIITNYGAEVREFNLADRAFKLQQENNAWRVCGYK
jgi:hypothetical protein